MRTTGECGGRIARDRAEYLGGDQGVEPEIISIYGNDFGPTSVAVTPGSVSQSGVLSLPSIKIGGLNATVSFAGLVSPGLFQFNVVVPDRAPNGDLAINATYAGVSTQSGTLLSVHQ